ncbi:hypothetical protein RJT34_16090 [Clitoria ternatea]|uniref:Uncharacterized protein n=1 Tax=Clitoria ternatea TaxID=43366 RepID=A0AAN9J6U5_CLITE
MASDSRLSWARQCRYRLRSSIASSSTYSSSTSTSISFTGILSLFPGGDTVVGEDEDPKEEPLGEPGPAPADVVMANPTDLPPLLDQLLPFEFLDADLT